VFTGRIPGDTPPCKVLAVLRAKIISPLSQAGERPRDHFIRGIVNGVADGFNPMSAYDIVESVYTNACVALPLSRPAGEMNHLPIVIIQTNQIVRMTGWSPNADVIPPPKVLLHVGVNVRCRRVLSTESNTRRSAPPRVAASFFL